MDNPQRTKCSSHRLSLQESVVLDLLKGGEALNSSLQVRASRMSWERLRPLLLPNHLAPLFYHRLTGTDLTGALEPKLAQELRKQYIGTAARNMLLIEESIACIQMLADAGVEAAPIQGLHTVIMFYSGNIAVRPLLDIDMLVRRADLHPAARVLARRGYLRPDKGRREHSVPFETSVLFQNRCCGTAGIKVDMELHYWDDIIDNPLWSAYRLDLQNVWSRLKEVQFAGTRVRVLGDIDWLLYHCYHSVIGHQFGKIMWYYDLITFVEQLPEGFDWRHAARCIRQAAAEAVVGAALGVARKLFDWQPPQPVTELMHTSLRISERRWVKWLSDPPAILRQSYTDRSRLPRLLRTLIKVITYFSLVADRCLVRKTLWRLAFPGWKWKSYAYRNCPNLLRQILSVLHPVLVAAVWAPVFCLLLFGHTIVAGWTARQGGGK